VTITGLTASTTYYYQIRSVDSQGNIGTSTAGQTVTTFVGLLDSYNNLYAAHAAKRVLSSYVGALYQLRRGSDNATLDVSPVGGGWPDKASIVSWLNGATGYITKIYDQTGNSRTLTQTTISKQPTLNLTGSHPVFDFDGASEEISGTLA